MPNLRTPNVFIDTQAFDSANLNCQSKAFQEIVRLAQGGFINVLSTSVTISEIESHIQSQIEDAAAALERFRNQGRVLRNVKECDALFKGFDKLAAGADLLQRFRGWPKKSRTTLLTVRSADSDAVFKKYFRKETPFGEGKKKHEFPDAFAQSVLSRWCLSNKAQMYVISNDGDWQSLANNSGPLLPLGKLEEFLDLALKDEKTTLSTVALDLIKQHEREIESEIRAEFRDSGFYLRDEDGSVEGVRIVALELGTPLLVDLDEARQWRYATAVISVDITFEADVVYQDANEDVWSSEDKTSIDRLTRYATVERTTDVDAQVSLSYKPRKTEDVGIDVECKTVTSVSEYNHLPAS
jgi:hypothetical protein